jgi:hypothetical protein
MKHMSGKSAPFSNTKVLLGIDMREAQQCAHKFQQIKIKGRYEET